LNKLLTLKLGSFHGIDLKNVSAEEIKNQYTLGVAGANALKVMYKFANLNAFNLARNYCSSGRAA
jgi:hypothetical protein